MTEATDEGRVVAISAAAPAGPLRATDTFERRASTQIAKLVQAELRVSILTRGEVSQEMCMRILLR